MTVAGLRIGASARARSNMARSALVVLVELIVAGAIGYGLGQLAGSPASGLLVGMAVAAIMSFASYLYGERIVLKAAGASRATEEQEPRLHNLMEGLCLATARPKPRLFVVPDAAMNAFSTGRGPRRSSIAVTRGLLDGINRVELEVVLAHELSHVSDRDVLLGTLLATLVGAPVLFSEWLFQRAASAGDGGTEGKERGGVAGGLLFALGVLVGIPALLFAPLIRLLTSPEREYAADAQGVTWTRYPPALVRALRKAAASRTGHSANWATGHLWLLQPSGAGPLASFLDRLFSTHPPVGDRIRILEEM